MSTAPTPMCLGPYQFHATRFGFRDIRRDLSTRWAEIATAGGLNRIQWTGGDADNVEIGGVVFPEEFGGLGTLSGLRTAAMNGQVLPLISIAGNVYGNYVVEAVGEDQSYFDRYGMPRMNAYRIGLRRYTGTVNSSTSIIETLFG